jgi:DNA-binding PadR family transcriptional regulator
MRRKSGALVPLELAICECLSRHAKDALHGYGIARQLQQITNHKLLTAYGTLYRALERLETMGLVESRWEDPDIAARDNRPRRRLYVLTAAGQSAAQEAEKIARHKSLRQLRRRPASA